MKRKFCIMLCGVLAGSAIAACGNTDTMGEETKQEIGSSEKTEDEKETEKDDTSSGGQTVTIWHDGDESIMQVIADEVNEELSDENITVSFEKKSGLTDQLQLYGNDAANGPDLYFYAHDSLGMFAEMGILAPITDFIGEDELDGLLPMTVEAGIYQDTQYLLPVYYETLLFLYNQDLWEGEVPSTTDELYAYMQDHTDTAAGTYAVVNQHSTAYNVAPVINGFGAYIIDKDANPGLDTDEMIEALTYNKQFAELMGEGDYDTCNTLFNEQKAAAIIGGPWLISGIKEAGISYGIKSLAEFTLPNGNPLAPYSGVQGVGVLKHAEDKKEAVASVLKAMADEKVGIALAKESNCAPANEKAYEDADVAANDMIMAMRETAKTAQPMPNIPQMSVMWGPAESLLAAVNKSGDDIKTAAETYQEAAKTAIADMQ
jgi:maltose-binding protein MalE